MFSRRGPLKRGSIVMNTEAVFLVVAALFVKKYNQPLAGTRQSTERSVPSTSSTAPAQAQETSTPGQLVPQKGELPPHPEVTPEESERLLKGTMRKVPDDPQSDADPSSSPPTR